MLLPTHHLRTIVLIMSLGALPVAAQTSDPVNDPVLGSSIFLNGGWTSASGTLVISQPDVTLTTYSTPLTRSTASISVTPGLIATPPTAGALVLSPSNSTTTNTSGSTINLGDLVSSNPLSGSLIYLSPVAPSTSTITTRGTLSGSLVTISTTISGSSLILSSGQQLTTGGTITLSSGTLVTNTSLNINGGTISLTNTASPVTISAGTVSLQSATTVGGNLDLQSNGTMTFYLNGTGSGTSNGQLTVAGNVTLSGDLAITPAANLPTGSTFVILNKTSTGPITGTFAGRPQGSVVNVNGNDFIISYTGGDGNDVSLTALSKTQLWRHIHFGTTDNSGAAADDADFDGDGIPNLLERACNLDPTAGSAAPFSAACQNSNLEFTYTRSLASVAAGDVFTVEWCDTLGAGWSSNGVTEEIQSDDGTVQVVKALVPSGTSGHRFMRLKVTPAP